jgi:large subunit ribosomal protein L29
MKAVELRELSTEELRRRLTDEQESLSNLQFQLATSQLESPIKVRTVRRDIARIMTILRAKERSAAPAAPAVQPTANQKTEVKTS